MTAINHLPPEGNTRKRNQDKFALNIELYLQQKKLGLKLMCPDHSKLQTSVIPFSIKPCNTE